MNEAQATELVAIHKRDAESAATWYTGPASPAAQTRRDRRALLDELERLRSAVRNARLTWAMVCPCSCDACDTLYEALKLATGDAPAHSCGNCGADLSKHPTSAGPHICPAPDA